MKRLLVIVVLALAVPCLTLAQATPQKAAPAKTESVAEQVMALERAWAEADRTQDLAWFERHLAESYASTDAFTGLPGTKAEYLADVKAQNFKAESITNSGMKVQVFGNVAVVTGVATLVNASYKGEDRGGKVRWTDTWVRRNGQWQCVASQATRVK